MTQGLLLKQGEAVMCAGDRYIIAAPHLLSPTTVLALKENANHPVVLKIAELVAPDASVRANCMPDLAAISEKQWNNFVQPRLDVINAVKNAPVGVPIGTVLRPVLDALAREGRSVSIHTAYRWLRHHAEGRHILTRAPRSDRGEHRLHPNAETIIEFIIEEQLFGKASDAELPEGAEQLVSPNSRPTKRGRKKGPKKRMTVMAAINAILHMCQAAGLEGGDMPHPNTIRDRIKAQKKKRSAEFARAQQGKGAARALQSAGAPHLVDRPNKEWQCDHTRMGIHVVHRETRETIGRPTITFISDTCTRVILSWHASLEAPSSVGVGIALTDAILPKDELIVRYNLSQPWNAWGKPTRLLVDNAKEFRGHALQLFCKRHGIDLLFRPVGKPQYGGHIERLVGTFETLIKSWHGATGSNPRERGDYDAEGNAIYDLDQLNARIALEVERYNNTLHRGLQGIPLETYEQMVFGDDGFGPGEYFTGPAAERLRLDGLPHKSAWPKLRREGFTWDNITYFERVLDKLPRTKYIVRRDPRDLSVIYVWVGDDKTGEYHKLGYRDPSRPAISLWELKAARLKILAKSKVVNEDLLMAKVKAERAIEEQAIAQRKAALTTPSGARKARPDDKRVQRNDERRERNTGTLGSRGPQAEDTFTGTSEVGQFTAVDDHIIEASFDVLGD